MHTLITSDTTIGPTHVATSLATPNAYQPTTATTLGTTCYLGLAQEHWGSVRQPGRMPGSQWGVVMGKGQVALTMHHIGLE